MTSMLPFDDEFLSEEELALLERAMEMGGAENLEFDACKRAKYLSAFKFVDELVAPVRTAIQSLDFPPTIEGYDELTEIARGGMGIIFRGLHKKTNRYDAVKVMRPDRIAGATTENARMLRLQFLRESQLAARVAHEHIVPVYQVGETDDRPWYSMQFVNGSSLYELAKNSTVSSDCIVSYIEQIARAVDVVHRHGILHGDIKPHNILIEDQTNRPMISDFGLAVLDAASNSSEEAGIAGTPAYMAPELANAVIQGLTTSDICASRTISSDVYSLGATLWASLTGCSPCYGNRTLRERLADVAVGDLRFKERFSHKIPHGLAIIINRCIALTPEMRFSTAGELADALAHWLERPRWNRYFPKLRNLLCVVVAPVLLVSCWFVQLLLAWEVSEYWIWLVAFTGYAALFSAFLASRAGSLGAQLAHRELWSIWGGHFCASITGMIALHFLCQPDVNLLFKHFYPYLAAISSLVFFAKSGNFWAGYRWMGIGWSIIAVLLALTEWAPVLFGIAAATTCILIAGLDRAFLES